MSLIKSSAIISSMTMLSRVFGFLRDVAVANVLGASWLSDAFFVAFKLPNFFRRLFAEGAFNAAFVPQFAGTLKERGRKDALELASEVLSVLLLALLALNALFLIGMPWILPLFAPGFLDAPDKLSLTIDLARICFPYILFISLVSLLSGILNSVERFAAVAATPVLLNFCLIGGLYGLSPYLDTPAHALAVSAFIAGIVQLVWLIWHCRRHHALPHLRLPRFTPRVKKLMILMAPAALGAGVAQINLLIDLILASHFDEGVSYLYYADRLNELPIGVIGVAVGTALLPLLSKQIRSGDVDQARRSINRAAELVLLFGIPAATALVILPEMIISVLYEHGAFTPEDTAATYTALIAYAAGLPAFVLIKVFAPGFFANEDTKTPFIIATICVGINLAFNLILMQYYAHVGLAMATSIAGWVNALLMAIVLYRRRFFLPDRIVGLRLLKILFSSAVMGIGLYITPAYLGTLPPILALVALVAMGKLLYWVAIIGLGTLSIDELRHSFSKADTSA